MKELYKINLDYAKIRDEILRTVDEETGEIDPILISDLTAVEEQFRDKAIAYGCVMRELQARQTYAESQKAYYDEQAKKAKANYDALKKAIDESCKMFGVTKITSPDCNISYRLSKSVDPYNVEAIHDEYFRCKLVKEVDKIKIGDVLKAGGEVPGARLVEEYKIQIK